MNKLQRQTYKEMLELLDGYRICNVVRPPGFGKTVMFMEYAKRNPNRKILFIEDTRGKIDELKKYGLGNVQFITYHAFRKYIHRLKDKIENINQIDTFIFDESHNCGSEIIRNNWEQFRSERKGINKDIKIIGATATNTRTDLLNVTKELFDRVECSQYSISDAHKDRLFKMPDYYTCIGHMTKEDEEQIKSTCRSLFNHEEYNQSLRVIERANNLGCIIKDAVEEANISSDYMKFIVYYSTIQSMTDDIENISKQLRIQYPEHTINVIPVSSDKEHRENVRNISNYKYKPKTIDVFMSVNIMIHGFHFNDLTGIVLIRGTSSPIVFTQQIGRTFNLKSKKKSIVIDVACNINTDFQIDNPFKELFGMGLSSGARNENKVVDVIEIKMTPEQQKLRYILEKLDSINKTPRAANERNLITIYKMGKEHSILDPALQRLFNKTPMEMYEYLKEQGVLLTEDFKENIPNSIKREFKGDENAAWVCWFNQRYKV